MFLTLEWCDGDDYDHCLDNLLFKIKKNKNQDLIADLHDMGWQDN